MELHIELRSLTQGGLYTTNLGNLRTDMEMDESQTVFHILLLQQVEGLQQLGTGQSELRSIAATLFPLATTTAGQLDADADIRTHAQLLCLTGNDIQFVQLLHDDKDTLAHLLCQQGQFDVRLVFVAVTDNDTIALALYGNDCMQLRLGTCLDTQIELTTVRDNLLNDRLHLVDLDGEHYIVLCLVVVLLSGFLETAPRLLDTVIKNVGEAQQHRSLHVAQRQFVHHLTQVYLRVILTRSDIDVTFFVDAEVAGAPAVDVVQLLRVVDGPFLHVLMGLMGLMG